MAANPYTLAALATTAVPDLVLTGAVDDGSDDEYEAVAARTRNSDTVRIVVPRTQHSLQRMRDQVRALRSFSAGVRERLPFDVPVLLGDAPLAKTAVFVWSRLGGSRMSLADLTPAKPGLAASIGEAIAAVHSLPTSIIADAALPHRSSGEVRGDVLAMFDRAAATGKVPSALLSRWESAADDQRLWQFSPTVIHADLQSQALRVEGEDVAGVSGWHALSAGDPARDLAWLLGSSHFSMVDATFAAYVGARAASDASLKARAMLHAELDIARWLLHGIDTGDDSIVADAVGMLDSLVGRVDDDSAEIAERGFSTMDLSEVEAMLRGRGAAAQSTGPVGRSRAAFAEQETEPFTTDAEDSER